MDDLDPKLRTVSPTTLDHGGDLAAAELRFGRPPGGWLDLSTGINPMPYAALPVAGPHWSRLPSSSEYGALRAAAAGCYGVSDSGCVVAAPGTQAIIQWLPYLRPKARVAVVGPTYSEHAESWRRAGHEVAEVEALDAAGGAAEVVVVVNPNNPDGRRRAADKLLSFLGDRASSGGWLVVDEAFADVAPEISVAGAAGSPGLVVLRSFGKFFGLPGLRLGFALADREIAALLERALGPWAVSGPAIAIGMQALSDRDWSAATRRELRNNTGRLDEVLAAGGLRVAGGCDLFRHVIAENAQSVFAALARSGILVRRFGDHPTWLRFGLPGGEVSLGRLAEALAAIRESGV